jgi:hypothetical protein
MPPARFPVRQRSRSRRRLDPRREIDLHHVTDGPAKGWIHTHGLAAHGRPELEIRNVPLFLGGDAARLLNDIAAYLLNDVAKPFVAGNLIHGGRAPIQVVEAHPDEDAGYDASHYRTTRLMLVDPPDDGCRCEECAAELARRGRVAH